MTTPTRLALYFGTYSGRLIGIGITLIGLSMAVEGYCCWRQARGEE